MIEVNELQKRRVIVEAAEAPRLAGGKEIALLGLAFKPNTDDMREASSLVLSARLQAAGAKVRAYDPVAEERGAQAAAGRRVRSSAEAAVDGADAVVLVTEWPEFRELDLRAVADSMRGTLLVDGRNFLDPEAATAAGLEYEGVGRPTVAGRQPVAEATV